MKPPLTQKQRVKAMAWLINDLYIKRGLPYPPPEKPNDKTK